MQSKVILLIVPPIVALAMMWFFKTQDFSNEHTQALPEQAEQNVTTEPTPVRPIAKSNLPIPKSNNSDIEHPNTDSESNSPLSAIEQIRAIKNKTALHEAVLKEHEDFTRYPSQNTRIERPERDPVLMTYETHERSSLSEDQTASITAWTDKKYIINGDAIKVFARVDEQGQSGISNKLLGQLIFNESTVIGAYEFTDNNSDGTYEMSVSAEATESFLPGIYKVIVVSNVKDLSESVSFIVSPPLVALTGEFKDRIVAPGNLEMSLEVEVQKAGRYYVRGSLYSINGSPVGSAEFGNELSPGKHWVTLQYFGRMFHDADEPGPYRLQNIELAKAGVPMYRMPAQSSDYLTESYPLESFDPRTYGEQNALQ